MKVFRGEAPWASYAVSGEMHASTAWFKALNLDICTQHRAVNLPQPSFCIVLMGLLSHKQGDTLKWVLPILTFDSFSSFFSCSLNLLLLTLEIIWPSKAFNWFVYLNMFSVAALIVWPYLYFYCTQIAGLHTENYTIWHFSFYAENKIQVFLVLLLTLRKISHGGADSQESL